MVSHPKGRGCELPIELCREAHPILMRLFMSQLLLCYQLKTHILRKVLNPTAAWLPFLIRQMDPDRAAAKAPRDPVFLQPLFLTDGREWGRETPEHRVLCLCCTSWKKARHFVIETFLLTIHPPTKQGHPCRKFWLWLVNKETCHWVIAALALFAVVVLLFVQWSEYRLMSQKWKVGERDLTVWAYLYFSYL